MHEGSAEPLAVAVEQLPEPLRAVAAGLITAGHSAYLVGGSLRDLLLGRMPRDWDLATSAHPEEMRRLFAQVIPTGEKHGTLTVLTGGAAYEVTTLRADGVYSDMRRPDSVEFTTDVERDLARRDFTVNAMALDLRTGLLIDPLGGRTDLAQGVIRAVGDPADRFAEDALRLVRAARFAAQLGFAVDEATRRAMAERGPLVARIAPERVQKELVAMLGAPRPSTGIVLLATLGLLAHIMPELLEGAGVTQNRYHRYDVFTHGLFTVDRAPAGRPRVRLAALLHDVAKPRTRALRAGEATFYDHDKLGAEMTDTMLRRLRLPNADRLAVVGLVRHHLFMYGEEWSDAAVRRFIRRVGEDLIPDLFALRRADAAASGRVSGGANGLDTLAARVCRLLAAREAELPERLALSGGEVMAALGLEPGPEVGKWLAVLREAVLDDPGCNTCEQLLAILLSKAKGQSPESEPRG